MPAAVVDMNTPGADHIRVWFDGKLIGGVVRANDEEGWVDVRVVREVAGRRTITDEVVRAHGRVTLVKP